MLPASLPLATAKMLLCPHSKHLIDNAQRLNCRKEHRVSFSSALELFGDIAVSADGPAICQRPGQCPRCKKFSRVTFYTPDSNYQKLVNISLEALSKVPAENRRPAEKYPVESGDYCMTQSKLELNEKNFKFKNQLWFHSISEIHLRSANGPSWKHELWLNFSNDKITNIFLQYIENLGLAALNESKMSDDRKLLRFKMTDPYKFLTLIDFIISKNSFEAQAEDMLIQYKEFLRILLLTPQS